MKSIYYLAIFIAFISSVACYRLPKQFRPEYYKLDVVTHLGDENGFNFNGNVSIKIVCEEDTTNVTLHSKNLTIIKDGITLNELNGNTQHSVIINNIDFNIDNDFLIIFTRDKLKKGSLFELFIPFSADLTQGLLGYYRSSYLEKKTKKQSWMSVTQFEPTHARRAFPCFDEPDMKATFDISLAHNKKYNALSNMPIKNSETWAKHDDWVIDHFDLTVPMSTYLVAYSINDFEYREASPQLKDNVKFRIWARRDAIDQVEYAKFVGPKVLEFYENYFDIKFPLPKLDMIAIPDFSSGAMENWGLITYRETALLFQPNVSSASSQSRVASVIAHELAHQWFGNLVTMKWWTDLWLNEGFATYIASLGVEYLHPEWNSLIEESVENTQHIFKVDALKSSHPVLVVIGHPSTISQIFDSISYNKGSSILRMMHLFLGESAFRNGVSEYLKKHKFKNAEQDDLWVSLTENAHKTNSLSKSMNVKEIMDSWTLQTGYPLITVTRNYENNSVKIEQIRYLSDITRTKKETSSCWWVPLSYTDKESLDFNATAPKLWLKCDNNKQQIIGTIDNLHVSENSWLLFNIQLSGLYKVKYDKRNWNLLIDTLISDHYKDIHTINRAQIIDDALDLAWTGDEDYKIALKTVEYLKVEREYIPWKTALNNLNNVNRMLKRTSQYGRFKNYIKSILVPIYEAIGGLNVDRRPNDALDTVKHKVLISAWSCRFNVGDCVEKSKMWFKNWMASKNPDTENEIPLDLRSVVYCTAIRKGDENEWNFLWKRYLSSNVGTEMGMILSSLGCTKETWLLIRYLDYSLNSTSGVRKQDTSLVFNSIARNEVGYPIAKEFLYNNIENIYKYLVPDTSRLIRYLRPLADQMIKVEELNEIKSFVTDKSKYFERSSQGVKQALETIEIHCQWQAMHYNNVVDYLTEYNKKTIDTDGVGERKVN